MTPRRSIRLARALGALLALLATLQSCQAPAPRSRAVSRLGDVRAPSQELADEVAAMVDDLQPRVAGALPDAREEGLDVWVQEEPALYRFLSRSYEEADGFWAELPGRIHLRRGADDLRRTLAHELTHASLGASWRFLPGTIEEGLCDHVSARTCPEGAAAMRAGRLSAAAFAIGGLELEIGLATPGTGIDSCSARILLQSGDGEPLDPLEVFRVRAGLSTTSVAASEKKALYGLSYLVVERIAERGGIEALHRLCARADAEDRDTIASEWLLDAAGLDADRESWRRAIAAALGEAELRQLVRLYPRFVVEALEVCRRTFPHLRDLPADALVRLELSLPGGSARVVLTEVGAGGAFDASLAVASN